MHQSQELLVRIEKIFYYWYNYRGWASHYDHQWETQTKWRWSATSKTRFNIYFYRFPGFEYDYGFLDESCGLTIKTDVLYPLHQYMVNIRQPTMIIMGLVVRACLVIALDAQVSIFLFYFFIWWYNSKFDQK